MRYVYQPIENLFLLLVTNKASNIVEDLETLRMLSKGAVITLLSVAVLGAGSAVHRNLRPGASTVSYEVGFMEASYGNTPMNE